MIEWLIKQRMDIYSKLGTIFLNELCKSLLKVSDREDVMSALGKSDCSTNLKADIPAG